MPRSDRLIRWMVPIAMTWLPAVALGQNPGPAGEPPLDPMPGSQAPKSDRLPPLDPIAPADEPATSPVPPPRRPSVVTPARPQVAPAPAPAPAADEMMPGGAPIRVVPRGEVIEEDEPVVVQQVPAPTPMVVAQPPAVVWVAGHFEKKPDVVEMVPGRWEKPLIGAPRYIAARYVTRPGKIVWVEGHWAQTPSAAATVTARPVVTPRPVVTAAPAPRQQVVVSKPVYADPNVRVVQSPPVIRSATPAVVTTPAPAIVAPAPAAIVPGQWRQGLFGNWRYTPGQVVY